MIEAIKARMNSDASRSREDGFSMVEILFGLLIMVAAAAIVVPLFLNNLDNSRQDAVDSSAVNALSYATAEIMSGTDSAEIDTYLNDNSEIEHTVTGDSEDDLCVTAVGPYDHESETGPGCDAAV